MFNQIDQTQEPEKVKRWKITKKPGAHNKVTIMLTRKFRAHRDDDDDDDDANEMINSWPVMD